MSSGQLGGLMGTFHRAGDTAAATAMILGVWS